MYDITLTSEHTVGFWTTNHLTHLCEQLTTNNPADAVSAATRMLSTQHNYQLQVAGGCAKRLQHPLQSLACPSASNSISVSTWTRPDNLATVTVGTLPCVGDSTDSLLNFRRACGTMSSTGVLSKALSFMACHEEQIEDEDVHMHILDVVTVMEDASVHQQKGSFFFKALSDAAFNQGISQIYETAIGSPQYSSLWVQGAQPMKAILAKAKIKGIEIIRAPPEFLNAFGLREQDVSVSYPCLNSSGLWLVKKGNMSQLLFSVPLLGSNLTGEAGKFQDKVISIRASSASTHLFLSKDRCASLPR
jgi:hypothetical protein